MSCTVPFCTYDIAYFIQQKSINAPPDPFFFSILTSVVDSAPCTLDGTTHVNTIHATYSCGMDRCGASSGTR